LLTETVVRLLTELDRRCSFILKHARFFISPLMWPPNSTDLNPVDYEVWGVLQRRLYRTRIRDVDHLKQRLVEEWRHFSQDIMIIDRAMRPWNVKPRPHQQQRRTSLS